MTKNNKAQTQGTTASLLIGLVLFAGSALLLSNYIFGVGTNYGVNFNESRYAFFNQSQEITGLTNSMTNQFINENGSQNEDTDIITVMVTNSYSMVKLFFRIPSLFQSIIATGLNDIAIPPAVSSVLAWMAVTIITIIILFAAYEAVMKVRS